MKHAPDIDPKFAAVYETRVRKQMKKMLRDSLEFKSGPEIGDYVTLNDIAQSDVQDEDYTPHNLTHRVHNKMKEATAAKLSGDEALEFILTHLFSEDQEAYGTIESIAMAIVDHEGKKRP